MHSSRRNAFAAIQLVRFKEFRSSVYSIEYNRYNSLRGKSAWRRGNQGHCSTTSNTQKRIAYTCTVQYNKYKSTRWSTAHGLILQPPWTLKRSIEWPSTTSGGKQTQGEYVHDLRSYFWGRFGQEAVHQFGGIWERYCSCLGYLLCISDWPRQSISLQRLNALRRPASQGTHRNKTSACDLGIGLAIRKYIVPCAHRSPTPSRSPTLAAAETLSPLLPQIHSIADGAGGFGCYTSSESSWSDPGLLRRQVLG